jgi:hypothetical protein
MYPNTCVPGVNPVEMMDLGLDPGGLDVDAVRDVVVEMARTLAWSGDTVVSMTTAHEGGLVNGAVPYGEDFKSKAEEMFDRLNTGGYTTYGGAQSGRGLYKGDMLWQRLNIDIGDMSGFAEDVLWEWVAGGVVCVVIIGGTWYLVDSEGMMVTIFGSPAERRALHDRREAEREAQREAKEREEMGGGIVASSDGGADSGGGSGHHGPIVFFRGALDRATRVDLAFVR